MAHSDRIRKWLSFYCNNFCRFWSIFTRKPDYGLLLVFYRSCFRSAQDSGRAIIGGVADTKRCHTGMPDHGLLTAFFWCCVRSFTRFDFFKTIFIWFKMVKVGFQPQEGTTDEKWRSRWDVCSPFLLMYRRSISSEFLPSLSINGSGNNCYVTPLIEGSDTFR